jgi:hypothetical protein
MTRSHESWKAATDIFLSNLKVPVAFELRKLGYQQLAMAWPRRSQLEDNPLCHSFNLLCTIRVIIILLWSQHFYIAGVA